MKAPEGSHPTIGASLLLPRPSTLGVMTRSRPVAGAWEGGADVEGVGLLGVGGARLTRGRREGLVQGRHRRLSVSSACARGRRGPGLLSRLFTLLLQLLAQALDRFGLLLDRLGHLFDLCALLEPPVLRLLSRAEDHVRLRLFLAAAGLFLPVRLKPVDRPPDEQARA